MKSEKYGGRSLEPLQAPPPPTSGRNDSFSCSLEPTAPYNLRTVAHSMQWAVLRLDIDTALNGGEVMGGWQVQWEEVGRQQVGRKRGREQVSRRRMEVARGVTETLGERQEEEHIGRWTHNKHTRKNTSAFR